MKTECLPKPTDMNSAIIYWVILCLVGMTITLLGEYRDKVGIVALGKMMAASAYLLAALSMGAMDTQWGRVLFAGMLFCWGGDMCLVSRRHRAWFLTGLVLFLSGHILYSVAFALRGFTFIGLWPVGIMIGLFAWFVDRWLRPNLDRRMLWPVRAYLVAISVMWLLAVATNEQYGGLFILAGASLFVFSDLAVARNRFVSPGISNRLWGLPLYFSAQILLAMAVAN